VANRQACYQNINKLIKYLLDINWLKGLKLNAPPAAISRLEYLHQDRWECANGDYQGLCAWFLEEEREILQPFDQDSESARRTKRNNTPPSILTDTGSLDDRKHWQASWSLVQSQSLAPILATLLARLWVQEYLMPRLSSSAPSPDSAMPVCGVNSLWVFGFFAEEIAEVRRQGISYLIKESDKMWSPVNVDRK